MLNRVSSGLSSHMTASLTHPDDAAGGSSTQQTPLLQGEEVNHYNLTDKLINNEMCVWVLVM